MNLLADESVDKIVVDRLRQDQLPVTYIAEVSPAMEDSAILAGSVDDTELAEGFTRFFAAIRLAAP
ncbi:MAG TPA: hypothetical protein VJ063_13660 [Verrucomicrobiae bacterium]|nr:hypothetical protein [Verrucomicrobiae bacterium]